MLIVQACIAGGLLYMGFKALVRQRPWNSAGSLGRRDIQSYNAAGSATTVDDANQLVHQTSRYVTISSMSAGLSIMGAFGFPVLSMASVPLTVYATFPAFARAYLTLFTERRIPLSIVWAAVIVGALGTKRYILASLLTGCSNVSTLVALRVRHFNRRLGRELERDYRQTLNVLAQLYGAKPQSVWVLVDGVGIETPFEDLKVGEVVMVRQGEVSPVAGTVVDGTALVTRFLPPEAGQSVDKGPGAHVSASTLVISGSINVQVENF
jgi:cation transport ATPase